jgi:uncharacterized protein YbaR (Trm112 family)
MVVIFGWGAGQPQDLGEVAPTTCPRCHNQVFLHHIRSDKKVSLYFIPLVPYGSDEYLACPVCHAGLQLQASQQGVVTRMQAATHAFRTRAMSLEAYQPIVDQFWRQLGVDGGGAQVLHPTSAVPPPHSGADPATLAGHLEGLAKLHASGVLTDEEFAAAKRRLLET